MCLTINEGYTQRLGEWLEKQPGKKMIAYKVVYKHNRKSQYWGWEYPLGKEVEVFEDYRDHVNLMNQWGDDVNIQRIREMHPDPLDPHPYILHWAQRGGGLHVHLRRPPRKDLSKGLKVIKLECHAKDFMYAGTWCDYPSATFRKVKVLT